MGFLTTFTIYNDGIDLVKKYPEEFAEAVYNGSLKSLTHGESKEYSVGNFCNMLNVQVTRHADDHTMYVHMGNTVTEMNAYMKETESLCRNHPKFFDKILKFMAAEIKALKKLKKSIEEDNEPN